MYSLVIIASLTVLVAAQTEFPITSPTTATSSSTTGVIPAVNQENVRGPGLSYSGSESVLPASSSGHRSTTGQDEFGGHSLQHASHSAYADPNTGETDVKQSRYYFHINPYVGQASVYTDNAVGAINPDQQAANFFHRKHNVRVTPGHGSYVNAADSAAVTPQGNLAYQLFKAGTGDFLPTGYVQNRRVAQLYHANHPLTGGYTSSGVLNRNVYYGPRYNGLNIPVVFPVVSGQPTIQDTVQTAHINQDQFHPSIQGDISHAYGEGQGYPQVPQEQGQQGPNYENGPQPNYPGDQSNFQGEQTNFQGDQSNYPGAQQNFQGAQSNYPSAQSNFPGQGPATFDNLQNNYGSDNQNQNFPGQYENANGKSSSFNLNYRYSGPSGATESPIQQQTQSFNNNQGLPGKKK